MSSLIHFILIPSIAAATRCPASCIIAAPNIIEHFANEISFEKKMANNKMSKEGETLIFGFMLIVLSV
jgi:hypothetical protein